MLMCSKSDTCANYGDRCSDCVVIASPYDETPYYVEKRDKKVKFKIFFGGQSGTRADSKLNEWLKQNPNVRVVGYQYQATQVGHSICIMYEEESE